MSASTEKKPVAEKKHKTLKQVLHDIAEKAKEEGKEILPDVMEFLFQEIVKLGEEIFKLKAGKK